MQFYRDLERRRELIRLYLKKNPKSTFQDIKTNLHTKMDKVYAGGMNAAYEDAGINSPRTFKRMTKDEKQKIIINYIKNNPTVGGQVIRKDTKINLFSVFNDTEEAYKLAGVEYAGKERRKLRLRSKDKKREEIINIIKKNPLLNINEIGKLAKTHPYTLFKNIDEIYASAGIKFIGRNKRKISKQNDVINFLKNNKYATQREINNSCHTHVQQIFSDGIFEAYKNAGIVFPFERLKIHGSALKSIKDDAVKFEEEIARKLSGYGNVNRLVRTKRGIADIILERKGKKVAIELKNYKCHEISISQIKQLNRYLEDINSNLGFLVCLKKSRRDTFLMGENRIYVILASELSKISELIDKGP